LVGIKIGYEEGDLIGGCVGTNPGLKLGKFAVGNFVGTLVSIRLGLFDGNKCGLGVVGFNVGIEIGLLGGLVGNKEL